MEITLEEIQKKFEKLPEDLKWAIMAANIDEKVTAIGQTHGLNVEELGQLSLETHMVTLGYTPPEKFEESLKASLGFPDVKTKEIVNEINEKILKDIREKLMSLSKKEEEDATKSPIPTGDEAPEEKEEIKKEDPLPKDSIYDIPQEEKEKDLVKEIQNKKILESISSQKLFGSFQSPTVKTEYTLNNLSKNQGKSGTSVDQSVKIPIEATIKPASSDMKTVSPSYSIKEDPYRAKPE